MLNIQEANIKLKVRRRSAPKVFGWAPADTNEYLQRLDTHVEDILTSLELDRHLDAECGRLEKVIKETARICTTVGERVEDSRRLCDETQALIRWRRLLITEKCSKGIRAEASKLIQAAIKKDLKAWKHRVINKRLESFTDLKSIGVIRINGRK